MVPTFFAAKAAANVFGICAWSRKLLLNVYALVLIFKKFTYKNTEVTFYCKKLKFYVILNIKQASKVKFCLFSSVIISS